MKKSGREKRAEISLALFMFLVFCLLFQLLTALSQGMSTKCLTLLPSICLPIFFHSFLFFPFFPFAFPFLAIYIYICISLSLSLSLLLFFSSFYSMLLYSIILSICFSMLASHDLSVIFLIIAFHCFSFSVLFHFSFICILYCIQVLSLISVYYVFLIVSERLTYPGFA